MIYFVLKGNDMKLASVLSALAIMILGFPPTVLADELSDRLIGTYSSKETNFITVKRLTFTREKDGSVKVRGALVGFPDEVSIGEATLEPYANRTDKEHPDVALASFSSTKYKPLMVLRGFNSDGARYKSVGFSCYLTDADGKKVHVEGGVERE